MSNVAELAGLEAAIAEAELTDEEAETVKTVVADGVPLEEAVAAALALRETPEPEPQPEPQPEPPPGEPTGKQLQALDREQARHEARVHEIMGAFVAGFETCDECSGVGIRPPGPRVQTNPLFMACVTCKGYGVVETGSLRPGNEHRDCPDCTGRGYLEQLDEQGAPLAGAGTPALGAAPTQTAPSVLELAPAPTGGAPEPRFGVPAWMGDPNVGR